MRKRRKSIWWKSERSQVRHILPQVWDRLQQWYTEELASSLLRSSSSPIVGLCYGWDASWVSHFCVSPSCASEVNAPPSIIQQDNPWLENWLTCPAPKVLSLSKIDCDQEQTNLIPIPCCFNVPCMYYTVCMYRYVYYTLVSHEALSDCPPKN